RLQAEAAASGLWPREASRHRRLRASAQDASELACARRRCLTRGGRGRARRNRPSCRDACRGAQAAGVRGAGEGARMKRAPAAAKVNLGPVGGPPRDDRKHGVLTVLQRIALVDRLELEESSELQVEGFDGDTLVAAALRELAGTAGVDPRWRIRI